MKIEEQERLGVQWRVDFENAPLNRFLRIKYKYKIVAQVYHYEIVAKIIEYNEKQNYIKLELAPNITEHIKQKIWYADDIIAWSEE